MNTRTQYSPSFPWLFGRDGYVHPCANILFDQERIMFPGDVSQAMARYLISWLAASKKFLAKLPDERSPLLFKVAVQGEYLVVNTYRTLESLYRPADMQPVFCPDWRADSVFRFMAERVLNDATGSESDKIKLEVEHLTRSKAGVYYDKALPYSSFQMRLTDQQFQVIRDLREAAEAA